MTLWMTLWSGRCKTCNNPCETYTRARCVACACNLELSSNDPWIQRAIVGIAFCSVVDGLCSVGNSFCSVGESLVRNLVRILFECAASNKQVTSNLNAPPHSPALLFSRLFAPRSNLPSSYSQVNSAIGKDIYALTKIKFPPWHSCRPQLLRIPDKFNLPEFPDGPLLAPMSFT